MNKQQLANKIWASANKMRSKIDANEYKDYILGLIFYKFLCDNEEQYLRKDGWTDEDMPYLVEDYEDANAKETIEYCKNNIGYFIEYKYLFSTWLKPDSMFNVADLSAALNNFDRLVSPNYRSVYEKIFLTLQAGLSKLGENPASQTRALKDLIKLIKDIPTDGSQDYDVLGYVYEYLIGNFAANAGKKAGEFYTPHEVAILMSEIVAEHHKVKETIEIYDPTSGSGSLLITIGKNPADAEMDSRFKDYGVAPKSKADYAFLLHELHHIKPDGILTIVLPHGVLFRGDPEKDADGEGKIRKNLIEKNNIDAIIGLPANIFFGTGIPTLIMVLKQHRDNDDVLIINASKGFVKDGKQNKLRACDIKRITDTVRDRKSIPGFSRAVSRDEIRQNGYNLNIPRYVDSSEAAVQYDIYATMFGGIPENEIDLLDNYWQALPSLRSELFKSNEDGSPYASVKVGNIADAINVNADVKALQQSFADAFEGFEDMLHEHLITNVMSVKEMKEQDIIAEEIFHRLESIALVDKYTAYQVLADNWQIIINDIETIQSDGIDAVRTVEPAYKIKKDGDDEIEVPDGLKGRIMPFELVQSVNFQSELDAIAQLQAEVDECVSNLEDAPNNFTEEEAAVYLEDGDNLKLNKKKITKDAKAKGDFIEPDTKVKLKEIVALWDKQSKTNKAIKVAKTELEEKTIDAIENLTNEEVDFFLHKKWIDPICQGISNTLTVVLSTFEKAIVALEAKYAESYNEIESKITDNQSQLTEMIAQLTGDEFAIKGLNNLIKE